MYSFDPKYFLLLDCGASTNRITNTDIDVVGSPLRFASGIVRTTLHGVYATLHADTGSGGKEGIVIDCPFQFRTFYEAMAEAHGEYANCRDVCLGGADVLWDIEGTGLSATVIDYQRPTWSLKENMLTRLGVLSISI